MVCGYVSEVMAFNFYKIGARTPSDIHIPLGEDSHHLYERGKEINGLVRDTPRVTRSVLRVTNFLTGYKKASWRDYYKTGATKP